MNNTTAKADFLFGYRRKKEHKIIGLMSGTSLDGIDAALVTIMTDDNAEILSAKLEKHLYLPYSDAVRKKISELCIRSSARIDDLVYTHFGLSEWYAEAVLRLISEASCCVDEIDAVSLHGQTVWHAPVPAEFPGPDGPIPVKGTLQLGSPSVVSGRTGLPVIADFRAADMAAGGEGAPLAPYVDNLLFGSRTEGRAVQNIGGIGNVTVLPKNCTNEDIYAFDTGPGNMIIDAVVNLGTDGKHHYDPDGTIAMKGCESEELVEELMADPYFHRLPPKSTGREAFGMDFTRKFLDKAQALGLSFEDRVATATAFTAESIARAYRDFVFHGTPVSQVLVCGGGARNATLLEMLQKRLGWEVRVTTTDSFGVPDQVREAIAFSVLGHESLMGRPGNVPAVTGAEKASVLGVLTLGDF